MPRDSSEISSSDLDLLLYKLKSGGFLSVDHLGMLDTLLSWIGSSQNTAPHPVLEHHARKMGIGVNSAVGSLFATFDNWYEKQSRENPDWNLFSTVNQHATNERRYRLLLRLYHPDRGLIIDSIASARTNSVIKSFKTYKRTRTQAQRPRTMGAPEVQRAGLSDRHLVNLKYHQLMRVKLRSWLPVPDNLGLYVALGVCGVLVTMLLLLQMS